MVLFRVWGLWSWVLARVFYFGILLLIRVWIGFLIWVLNVDLGLDLKLICGLGFWILIWGSDTSVDFGFCMWNMIWDVGCDFDFGFDLRFVFAFRMWIWLSL